MGKETRITTSEWLTALQETAGGSFDNSGLPPGAKTIPEIARESGVKERQVRTMIEKMLEAGKAKRVGIKYFTTDGGLARKATAYVLCKNGELKK